MSTQQIPLTHEGILEMFREVDRKFQEIDRILKVYVLPQEKNSNEEQRQPKKKLQAWEKRHRKLMKELAPSSEDILRAKLTRGIFRCFHELGYIRSWHTMCTGGVRHLDHNWGPDFCLEDGKCMVIVDIQSKWTISVESTQKFIKKVEEYRRYRDGDKRRFMAAIALKVVPDDVRDFALKSGLFVIQRFGKTIEVIPPEGEPKVW